MSKCNQLSPSTVFHSFRSSILFSTHFKGFDHNDPNTYHLIGGNSAKLGIITDFPVESEQLCLNRVHKKIYQAFSYVLDDKNIYTNIGRIGYHRPTKNIKFDENKIEDRKEWKTVDGDSWLHLDMNPITNHATTFALMPTDYYNNTEIDTYKKCRVQGLLALVDCRLQDGGFECVPGFNNIMHSIWVPAVGKKKIEDKIIKHRYQFVKTDPVIQYIQKCPIRAGSLLIWDSRLPHNNYPNDSERPRIVQYIHYVRRDDPSVKPIKFGVEQIGPWGFLPVTFNFPPGFESKLNDFQKQLYNMNDPENENADTNNNNNNNINNNNNNRFKFCALL